MNQVLNIAGLLPSSGGQKRTWTDVLEALARALPGIGIALIATRVENDAEPIVIHAGYPQRVTSKIIADHWKKGPWTQIRRSIREGVPYDCSVLAPAPRQARSLPRTSRKRFRFDTRLGVLLYGDAQRQCHLTFVCPSQPSSPPKIELLALLGELAQQFRPAFDRISAALAARNQATLDVLERMGVPAILLDRRGAQVGMNGLARERIIQTGAVTVGANGTLRFPGAAQSVTFDDLLTACQRGPSEPNGARFLMTFDIPNQIGPNVLECIDLRGQEPAEVMLNSELADVGTTLVVFRCRHALALPNASDVRALNITGAEARTVVALLQGRTAEEHAAEIGIEPATVRWHVRKLYEGLHCRNGRAEVVNLIHGLIPARAAVSWLPTSD